MVTARSQMTKYHHNSALPQKTINQKTNHPPIVSAPRWYLSCRTNCVLKKEILWYEECYAPANPLAACAHLVGGASRSLHEPQFARWILREISRRGHL